VTDKKVNIETVKAGMANGISEHLAEKQAIEGPQATLDEQDKKQIIEDAAECFGNFLTALGVDWENDPNSNNTPLRVAKAYVNDLWKGRYEVAPDITAFPADGYDGIVFEGGIPLTSMCSHHHQTITGKVHVAYIPGNDAKVVGLSKLNRIIEHFGRRGAIQEQLTMAIHNAVDSIITNNKGVAVMIEATHNCVKCRGVKHEGAVMKTSKLTKSFIEEPEVRAEFYNFIK
jgi:GTP cyclohydrolase IA